jgi:hypothetical protein
MFGKQMQLNTSEARQFQAPNGAVQDLIKKAAVL